MGLDTAVKALATIVRAVSGIRTAPSYPEENFSLFPFAVCVAQTGSYELQAGGAVRGLHSLVVELHVARKDLQRDVEAAMKFADTVPAAIMADPTIGGTVQTFARLTYTFGPMNWSAVDTIGFRFVLENVKILT